MNRETVLSKLVRAINARGNYKAHLCGGPDGERLKLMIDDTGVNVARFVSVYPENQSRPGSATRWRMTIGPPGNKVQFMQRKDKEFDYVRGAKYLEMYANRREMT